MSDMGWTRYISSLDDAADLEMQADEKLARMIEENGLRGVLERALEELGHASMPMIPSNQIAEALWAASGSYCVRHPDPRRWHDTFTGGLCSADETCPTCHHEPRPARGHGCKGCSYYEASDFTSTMASILDVDWTGADKHIQYVDIPHTHETHVPGCFRCELSADEAEDNA